MAFTTRVRTARRAVAAMVAEMGGGSPMNRAIQYRQFGGPGVLEMVEVAESAPGAGEVRVVVKAVGLNPVDSKTFSGDARLRIRQGRLPGPPGSCA